MKAEQIRGEIEGALETLRKYNVCVVGVDPGASAYDYVNRIEDNLNGGMKILGEVTRSARELSARIKAYDPVRESGTDEMLEVCDHLDAANDAAVRILLGFSKRLETLRNSDP